MEKQRIKGRHIYFNELEHKYTDDMDNVYTSATTLIGKYHKKFDSNGMAEACERIGRNPNHPKYELYKNKTAKELLHIWEKETEDACKKGSTKHDYLEQAIKNANNFNKNRINSNNCLYTIDDILIDHNYGSVDLDYFKQIELNTKYPVIYNSIVELFKNGYKLYAEIGVYESRYLISGMIDLLAVKNDTFIIIDWKTNKAPIKFESGYFNKDNNRNIIEDSFVLKQDKMLFPIQHLPDSVGIHYTLQLSLYAYLVESFGFKCLGLILFHIRTVVKDNIETEVIKSIRMEYLKSEIVTLLSDHYSKLNLNSQKSLFK